MSKEFKKGQAVIHFSNWDSKGTWYFRRAIVKSCGAKQMTLEAVDSGEMMGCNFRPNSDTHYTLTWQGQERTAQHSACTMADMTDEEAHAVCIRMAEGTLAQEREHFANCLKRNAGAGYDNAIKRKQAELHEPRSRAYEDRAK